MVPAMCPGSVPVLCMCPDRRLGRRRPRSHPRQTTKTSLMPFFGRRRRRQVRTQSLSEPRSGSVKCEIHANTPKSQCSASHRAALRFTLALALASLDLDLCLGRPFAAKTSSQPASRESRERPSPQNSRGGSFPGRRQTAATPHAPPSGRAAGNCTEPTEAQPRMAPALVSALCPGSVPVLCMCPDRRLGLRWRNFQKRRERTPGPTRAHSGPQTAPCANVNGIAGPGAFYYTGRIPAANRRRRPDRITRSYTKCKPAEPRPVCTGATASVHHWSVRSPLFV